MNKPPPALAARVEELDRSQWLTADELRERQFEQLVQVARHHQQHSLLLRERLRIAGLEPEDLATPEGLARLPPMRRRLVQRPGEEVFAARIPASHAPIAEASTSGSTGEPVIVRRTGLNALDWQAHVVRSHSWHLPGGRGLRFCALRPRIDEAIERPDWGAPSAAFFATGPMLGLPNHWAMERQAERIAAFAPDILLAYPSNIAGLADVAAKGGPSFGLLQFRAMGETLTDDVRAEVAHRFGCPTVDCYTCEETGYVAIECPQSALHHVMAETLIVEILDDAGRPAREGESGRVVLSDLRNYATPLIRYEIGDRAAPGPPCPCGRGLPTLSGIQGNP